MGAAQTDTTTWTNQLTIVDTLYTSGNLGAYPMDAANAVELCVHDVDPTTGESDLQHLHGYAHLQATAVYRQRVPGRARSQHPRLSVGGVASLRYRTQSFGTVSP